MLIIFYTVLCKFFLQREMHGNVFAILQVPAAQSARHISPYRRLFPFRLGLLIPSCRGIAGMQASLPHITPFSPVPSKLAARYYTVTNGSRCISTTAAQHGAGGV